MLRLDVFLVGDDDGTRNDGGLLLRSQGHWLALNAGRRGLRALLGSLKCSSFNVRRNVRHCSVERKMFERSDSTLHFIKWCIEIVRSGNVSRHLLGWFDAGVEGGFALGLGKRVSAGGNMVNV